MLPGDCVTVRRAGSSWSPVSFRPAPGTHTGEPGPRAPGSPGPGSLAAPGRPLAGADRPGAHLGEAGALEPRGDERGREPDRRPRPHRVAEQRPAARGEHTVQLALEGLHEQRDGEVEGRVGDTAGARRRRRRSAPRQLGLRARAARSSGQRRRRRRSARPESAAASMPAACPVPVPTSSTRAGAVMPSSSSAPSSIPRDSATSERIVSHLGASASKRRACERVSRACSAGTRPSSRVSTRIGCRRRSFTRTAAGPCRACRSPPCARTRRSRARRE